MEWIWVLIGAIVAGPLWVAGTVFAARRIWRNARRLTLRSKGQEHLMELGQLVGGLAHEIKNPLSTINLNLTLLQEDLSRQNDELNGRLLRRLTSVQHEAHRLKDVLDDFLRFAGKFELNPVAMDVRRLVEELVDFFGPQADAAHVIIRTSLAEQPVRCTVDGDILKQALLNLMINAVQAMPEGGEMLIRVSSHSGRGVIEVIDTGVGVAPENLPKLFQVYYTTRQGGTGLGLPTTRRIIREHDGEITAESELGKGTRFVIRLPLAK